MRGVTFGILDIGGISDKNFRKIEMRGAAVFRFLFVALAQKTERWQRREEDVCWIIKSFRFGKSHGFS